MALKNSVAAIPVAIYDSANLLVGYQAFTTLPEPVFFMRINNTSDVGVIISFDGGAHDAEVINAGDFVELNFQNNASPNGYVCKMAAGTKVAIKWLTAAGTGDIYLSGYYQVQAN